MAVTPTGLRLREARKRRRITQSKLAERVGISVSYLNLIEHNKRAIGGALLNRLATELDLDIAKLSGQEDARLIQQLTELASEPIMQGQPLSEKGAEAIVSRAPEWARGIVHLHNAWRSGTDLIEVLSDQLNRDPYILETSHEILTYITSIRSFSEILEDHSDISEEQRQRFTSLLAGESKRLGNSARALFQFLSEREQENQPAVPAAEVDDFVIDNNNYFPALEEAATRIYETLQHAGSGIVDERALIDELAVSFGLETTYATSIPATGDPGGGASSFHLNHRAATLVIHASHPQTTQRFQLARVLFTLRCHDLLRATVDNAGLTSDEARERAYHALARYGAGALLLPYSPFLEAAEALRYDIQILMTRFGASFEQICHRLVTLRRPGESAVPFAFMRTDLAGNTSKRFSLPDLRLPRYGGACPLWAIYRAFLAPDRITTQLVEFPDNRRFLLLARAISKEASAYASPQQTYSIMLACNARYADRLVYGDALTPAEKAPATAVGVNCRLCPRGECPQRAHTPLRQ
jgi:predicted transcriptional regulator/transcriptional regulator with XRE-family HTH domain